MKRALKEAWLTALRSGEYIQGKSYLKKFEDGITKHCCLGVYCEIRGVEAKRKYLRDTPGIFDVWSFRDGAGQVDQTLPSALQEEVGFGFSPSVRVPGLYDRDGDHVTLAGLNDEGFTFEQITDIIDYFIPAED